MVVNFEPGERVHVIGVGGAGMSGLARLLAEKGCIVSGSDVHESATLDELRAAGVLVHTGHDASNGSDARVVLWSPAVRADNVELVAARRRGALLLRRGEALAALAGAQRVIGLTGTHGKTTATSMLVHVMLCEGRDDSRLLGASVTGVGANGHFGADDLLLEVDESFGTFSLLHPYALGVLNVEADHLDHYGSLENLEVAFAELIKRTSGPVVIWRDDEGARRVSDLAKRVVVDVGTSEASTWRVSDVQLSRRNASFVLRGPGREIPVELRVTGLHNVANAAVVATLAAALDVRSTSIERGLANFVGAPRRFQYLGSWRGVDVYEDYAHLPGEIAATIRATSAAGYERIAVVFQPHRVTRTVNLASGFESAFEGASYVVVTDIYGAGEPNPTGVTGEILLAGIQRHSGASLAVYAQGFDGVVDALASLHDRCDVVLFLGAGDIADAARALPGGVDR